MQLDLESLESPFDRDYYEFLQDEIEIHKHEIISEEDSAGGTSAGDFIVSAYEVGVIEYDQAVQELRFQVQDVHDLDFWLSELNAAQWMREDS